MKDTAIAPRLYYGWVVIGTLFTVTLVSTGTRFSFAAFYTAILDDFDWSRAVLAGAASITLILAGAVRPLLGVLVDRYTSKKVLMGGLLLASFSLFLLSNASELWHFYVLFAMMSLGYAAASPVTAVPLVSRWFVKRRAIAQSIAGTGGPTGELAMVPILTAILLLTDWQTAYRILAVIVLMVLLPATFLLIRNDPADVGQAPDNDPEAEQARQRSGVDQQGMTLRQAMRTRMFWQLGFGFLACGFTMSFANTHFMAFAGDMAIEPMTASFAMGAIGGMSIIASISIGHLADRYSAKKLLALVYAIRGLAFFMFWLIPHTDHRIDTLFVGVLLLGLSWGSTTSLTWVCIADVCGKKNLGSISSTMFAIMPLGSGVGAFLAALTFDFTGSYAPMLLVYFIMGTAAAIVIYYSNIPDREVPQEIEPEPTRPEPIRAQSAGGAAG